LAINGGGHTDKGSAIGAYVVLIGAELSTLASDTLELLLGRSVCVTNLHWKTLITNKLAGEVFNDFITNLTRLETALLG
jgi:hypothetical protein